jgi:hypothetical protein
VFKFPDDAEGKESNRLVEGALCYGHSPSAVGGRDVNFVCSDERMRGGTTVRG